MSTKLITGIVATIAVASLSGACLADDSFHVHYRVENLIQDTENFSGTVFLSVYNTSGEAVTDMVAWIPEPNQVTYDQHPIGVGNLADGAQVQVMDPFVVPIEMIDAEPVAGSVTWRLEYSNALGERKRIDIVGLEAQ